MGMTDFVPSLTFPLSSACLFTPQHSSICPYPILHTLCPRHVSLSPPLARLTLASPQGEKGSKGERGVTTVNGKEVAAAILEGPPGPPGESYGSVMTLHLPLHFFGTFHDIFILAHVIND